MKKFLLFFVILAALAVGLVLAYRQMHGEVEAEKEVEEGVAAPSRVTRKGKEVFLTLDAETQQRIQLKVESLSAATLLPERKAYGRVLDPSPLGALMAELSSAQAAQRVSSKEFERLKGLREQGGNASARALEAAEATAQRDEITWRWARDRVALTWGQAIASQTNLPSFVQSLTGQDAALVRIDLPAGEKVSVPPTGARVVLLAEEVPVPAQLLGPAPSTNPELQGQGYLLLIAPRPPGFLPGAAVTGFLAWAGEPRGGVVVPREAILRVAGKGFVFLQTGNETFIRREIPLDQPAAEGWFVSAGLAANDRVVTRGAQTLLSEEFKMEITGEE